MLSAAAPQTPGLNLAYTGMELANPEASTAIQTEAGFAESGSTSLLRRIAAISRYRDFLDPLVAFNVLRARQLAQDYTRGWFADLQWTYFFLEWTDEDLFALADRRTSRLLEMDCVAKTEREADKTLAAEQSAMIDERIGKIDNLYDAIEHLAMAKFRGYSHLEKWHDAAGDLNHLEIVDQWNVVRDGMRGGWKYNPHAVQTGYFGLPDEYIISPEDFIIRLCPRHIDRIALLKFTSKKLGNLDWDAFLEIYGIPSGVVIGPPNLPPDRAEDFRAAAEEISQGGSGFLPYGSLYEKNDFPTGNAPFKERLEYLTEKLVLVGTGGALTMLTKSGSGTLAGNAHQEVFEQLAKADARQISALLNRAIVYQWLDEEFPGQPRAARLEIAANEETKTGDVVQHIKDLYLAGLAVDAQDASERTGYKLTRIAQPTDAGGNPENEDPDADTDAKVTNRAPTDAKRVVLERNSIRQITAAQAEAMGPVLDRIAALKDAPADELVAKLTALRADLPKLYAAARLHTPDVADVWDDVLGTAFADGFSDLPSSR